jgi:thioredoxin-related protein
MKSPLMAHAVLLLALLLSSVHGLAADATMLPPWFTETFLDIREDVADAAKDGKRLMLFFEQDGCPYCKQLLQVNFSQKAIADKARSRLTSVVLNIWGDREVTWTDGRKFSEKQFATFLKIQFTPTLVFFDEQGKVVARINGYYPPHRFEAVLDWVAGRMENRIALAEHLRSAVREPAGEQLHDEPFFLKPPYDLRRVSKKPLAVLFETPSCAACDELHREALRRPEIAESLKHFDVVRFGLGDRTPVVTPGGQRLAAEDWARSLGIAYTPSVVFFGTDGTEALRIEAYLRPFHLWGSLEYVASRAYLREPSFQRYLQARAERLREGGHAVDLWR